jgi:hypothetical protein
MMNLKKFFQPNPCLLSVSRGKKEILECFVANKSEFENWVLHHSLQRVRFQFYFPTAVDFYFDDFLLFTAYFKRTALDNLELQELKMTKANYSTIRSGNWKPFEEVMVQFLHFLEEKNKISFFRRTRSLHEYVSLCEKGAQENSSRLSPDVNPAIAAG